MNTPKIPVAEWWAAGKERRVSSSHTLIEFSTRVKNPVADFRAQLSKYPIEYLISQYAWGAFYPFEVDAPKLGETILNQQLVSDTVRLL